MAARLRKAARRGPLCRSSSGDGTLRHHVCAVWMGGVGRCAQQSDLEGRRKAMKRARNNMPDPAEIAVIAAALHSVAVEMGAALRRTAFSPNIKERRDYSSAVFGARGDLIAMGDDMPVHLGSMPMSVRAALDAFDLAPG